MLSTTPLRAITLTVSHHLRTMLFLPSLPVGNQFLPQVAMGKDQLYVCEPRLLFQGWLLQVGGLVYPSKMMVSICSVA